MPRTVRLRPGHGAKILSNLPDAAPLRSHHVHVANIWQRDKVEGLVVLGQAFWLVRRESPATDSFIMCHEDFPNKALYDTKRVVHIT